MAKKAVKNGRKSTPNKGKSAPRIERVDIRSLTADPANVRIHDDRNVKAIAASLRKFGQQKPLVISRDGTVIAGNGTLEAAKSLGWTKIDVVRTKLSPTEAVGYSIADNRTGELARWDYEAMAKTIQSLKDEDFDILSLGWEEHELEPLLQADWSPPALEELPGPSDSGESGDDSDSKVLKVTPDEREAIDEAIARVRADEGDDTLTGGYCVAHVCRRYLET